MKNTLLIIICLLSISCKEEVEINAVNFRVNHFKQTAVGVDRILTLLVQEGDKIGSDDWVFLYSEINGFEYELGYIYDITVSKQTNENPPVDGSSIQYELLELISKNEVDDNTSFQVDLKSVKINPSSFVSGDFESGYSLLGEIPINCDTLCVDLLEALDNENEVVGRFVHQGSDAIKLIEIVTQ